MNSLVDRYFLSDVNDVYYSPQWKFNITIGLLSTVALLYFIHMPLRLSCIYIIKIASQYQSKFSIVPLFQFHLIS